MKKALIAALLGIIAGHAEAQYYPPPDRYYGPPPRYEPPRAPGPYNPPFIYVPPRGPPEMHGFPTYREGPFINCRRNPEACRREMQR